MRTTEIKCDTCQIELNECGPMPMFRLHLVCERVPQTGGITYAVPDDPPMRRGADFCSMACLSEWAEKHPYNLKKKAVA